MYYCVIVCIAYQPVRAAGENAIVIAECEDSKRDCARRIAWGGGATKYCKPNCDTGENVMCIAHCCKSCATALNYLKADKSDFGKLSKITGRILYLFYAPKFSSPFRWLIASDFPLPGSGNFSTGGLLLLSVHFVCDPASYLGGATYGQCDTPLLPAVFFPFIFTLPKKVCGGSSIIFIRLRPQFKWLHDSCLRLHQNLRTKTGLALK